jgi:hypothetical protein
MHNQEIVILASDPTKSENKSIRAIFENRIATVLWCSIRNCHAVDQYFNDNIIECASNIDTTKHNYHIFLESVSQLTKQYGRVCVYETQFAGSQYEIDHEFWGDVFNAILHRRCFRYEIKTVNESVES